MSLRKSSLKGGHSQSTSFQSLTLLIALVSPSTNHVENLLKTLTEETIAIAFASIFALQKNMLQVVKKEVTDLKKFVNDDQIPADLKLEKFEGLMILSF